MEKSDNSATQEQHIGDDSQHYMPEMIQINMENTILEENEDVNSIECHQAMTHMGMDFNPNFDAGAVSIEGLAKPSLHVSP